MPVIHFPGFVSSECLPALFQAADVAVYPSCYEGFGLPVLEAMACGAPMVTSDIEVLTEVGGDAALRYTPGDPAALAGQLDRFLNDPDLRERHRQSGIDRAARFQWATTARLTMEVIERVAQR